MVYNFIFSKHVIDTYRTDRQNWNVKWWEWWATLISKMWFLTLSVFSPSFFFVYRLWMQWLRWHFRWHINRRRRVIETMEILEKILTLTLNVAVKWRNQIDRQPSWARMLANRLGGWLPNRCNTMWSMLPRFHITHLYGDAFDRILVRVASLRVESKRFVFSYDARVIISLITLSHVYWMNINEIRC